MYRYIKRRIGSFTGYVRACLLRGGCLAGGVFAYKNVQAAEESAHQGGLPQLDISTWPSQIFWLVITFSISYLLMSQLILPKINKVIEARQEKITQDTQQAKEWQEKAVHLDTETEALLSTAHQNAATHTKQAVDSAMQDVGTQEAESQKEITKQAERAQQKLNTQRQALYDDFEQLVIDAVKQSLKTTADIDLPENDIAKYVTLHLQITGFAASQTSSLKKTKS